MPLTSAAAYKLAYPDAASAEDAEVEGWIAAAQAAMEAHCRRKFDLQQHVEHARGYDGFLYLLQRPIVSVALVESYWAPNEAGTAVAPSLYEVYDAAQAVVYGPFGRCTPRAGYRVTYTAGYADGAAPADLARLCLLAARALGQQATGAASGVARRVALGTASVEFAGAEAWAVAGGSVLPAAVIAGLIPHVNRRA